MKSKKAQKYLDENYLTHKDENYEFAYLYYDDAVKAVEIAESELLETHVSGEKAVEAHASFCGFLITQECRLSDFHTKCELINNCSYKLDFLQKLNE